MLQPKSSTSRVMMIGLSSKELSLIDLSVLNAELRRYCDPWNRYAAIRD